MEASDVNRSYVPGDIADGHILGADGAWHPLPPKAGDSVNGHVLGPDSQWHPIPEPARHPFSTRVNPKIISAAAFALLGIVGVIAVAGIANAGTDADTPDTTVANSGDEVGSATQPSAADRARAEELVLHPVNQTNVCLAYNGAGGDIPLNDGSGRNMGDPAVQSLFQSNGIYLSVPEWYAVDELTAQVCVNS